MDFVALYTSTDGRISRKTWWIWSIVLAVIVVIVDWLVVYLFAGQTMKSLVESGSDPALAASLSASISQTAGWVGLVALLVFGWPIYCLGVKRRHDMNNNGYDLIGYIAIWALTYIVQGITGVGILVTILDVIALIYAIYMLVVLGFLKGTTGANNYGADPLGGTAAAAA